MFVSEKVSEMNLSRGEFSEAEAALESAADVYLSEGGGTKLDSVYVSLRCKLAGVLMDGCEVSRAIPVLQDISGLPLPPGRRSSIMLLLGSSCVPILVFCV